MFQGVYKLLTLLHGYDYRHSGHIASSFKNTHPVYKKNAYSLKNTYHIENLKKNKTTTTTTTKQKQNKTTNK